MTMHTMLITLAQTVVPLPGTALMGFALMGGAALFIRMPCHRYRRR